MEALADARIIHFTSTYLDVRPWVEGCKHPYMNQWYEYMEKTPWKGYALQKDNRSIKKKIIRKILMCIPSLLRLILTGFIHAYVKPLKYVL